jgi:hypothetical protein
VSPNSRSLEFFLRCEDDILESILQTSVSCNRVPLVIFWLIAGFRCGFKEELLAIVSMRLDLVWKLCFRLQDENVISMTEIDVIEMEKCGHELEAAWMEVLRGIRGARAPYCEGSSCLTSMCSRCGQSRELSPSQARSLALSTFVDGHVDRESSDRIKIAALESVTNLISLDTFCTE